MADIVWLSRQIGQRIVETGQEQAKNFAFAVLYSKSKCFVLTVGMMRMTGISENRQNFYILSRYFKFGEREAVAT